MNDIIAHGDNINILLARYGVKFGIYKNGVFHEQLFPFDPIPRVISAEDFSYLERGLKQRAVQKRRFGRAVSRDSRAIRIRLL